MKFHRLSLAGPGRVHRALAPRARWCSYCSATSIGFARGSDASTTVLPFAGSVLTVNGRMAGIESGGWFSTSRHHLLMMKRGGCYSPVVTLMPMLPLAYRHLPSHMEHGNLASGQLLNVLTIIRRICADWNAIRFLPPGLFVGHPEQHGVQGVCRMSVIRS